MNQNDIGRRHCQTYNFRAFSFAERGIYCIPQRWNFLFGKFHTFHFFFQNATAAVGVTNILDDSFEL